MILEAELFAIFLGPLFVCCLALSIFSEKLGYLKLGLYVFILIWSIPLAVLTDLKIGAGTVYVTHYAQLPDVPGISKFDLAGMAIFNPFTFESRIHLWMIILTVCIFFFIFSAGWRWLKQEKSVSDLAIY